MFNRYNYSSSTYISVWPNNREIAKQPWNTAKSFNITLFVLNEFINAKEVYTYQRLVSQLDN